MSSSPTWPDQHKACLALAFDLDGPTGDAMLNGSIWHKPESVSYTHLTLPTKRIV